MASCHHVMATKTDEHGEQVPAYCCDKCGVPMRIQRKRNTAIARRKLLR